jgi:hypothetical protein
VQHFDVNTLEELPPLPAGMRYFDFLGGTKTLRCYLVPEEMPRPLFIAQHENDLDECMQAIYANHGICVRQDSSHPTPAFYIVSPTGYFRSVDAVDELTNIRMFFILREIRKAMREALGIQFIHLYYEERATRGCNVHYWLLPIYEIDKYQRIYQFDIKKYLDSFSFEGAREHIVECNAKMRSFLAAQKVLERDNELLRRIT